MSFINLKDLIPQSLSRNSIKPQVEATNVLTDFVYLVTEVWNEEVASFVEPKYLKDGILCVHCKNSATASALQSAKNKLVEELNKFSKTDIVKDIIFQQ